MRYRCRTIEALVVVALLTAPASQGLGDTHPADAAAPGQAHSGDAVPMVRMHGSAGHGGHQEGAAHAAAPADADPVVQAFREANERMHAAMSVPLTGDADRDFAVGMIAHHQGAIEMAEILLEHGRDPELRALAEEVIEVQEREIDFLQRWLAENPE